MPIGTPRGHEEAPQNTCFRFSLCLSASAVKALKPCQAIRKALTTEDTESTQEGPAVEKCKAKGRCKSQKAKVKNPASE